MPRLHPWKSTEAVGLPQTTTWAHVPQEEQVQDDYPMGLFKRRQGCFLGGKYRALDLCNCIGIMTL